MANPSDLATFTLLVGPDGFTAEQLEQILDTHTSEAGVVDTDMAAASVWEIRAGRYHALTNMSESGSSRNLGDLYKNAIAMATYFRKKREDDILDPGEPAPAKARTRTTAIVRP